MVVTWLDGDIQRDLHKLHVEREEIQQEAQRHDPLACGAQHMLHITLSGREGGREWREGRRDGGSGGREGVEGGREGVEGGRDGGTEGGRDGGRDGGSEDGEGGQVNWHIAFPKTTYIRSSD